MFSNCSGSNEKINMVYLSFSKCILLQTNAMTAAIWYRTNCVGRAALVKMSTAVASIAENSGGGTYAYRCKAALNMAMKSRWTLPARGSWWWRCTPAGCWLRWVAPTRSSAQRPAAPPCCRPSPSCRGRISAASSVTTTQSSPGEMLILPNTTDLSQPSLSYMWYLLKYEILRFCQSVI